MKKLNLIICIILVFTAAGCTTMKTQPSGFLNDYGFIENTEENTLRKEIASGIEPGQYTKIIIDPVIVFLHPDAKASGVAPDRLMELAEFFTDEMIMAFSDNYTIVEEPGPGVLRLRTAITDVLPNKVYLNLHWSTTACGFGTGGASMEAEFVDDIYEKSFHFL